MKRWTEEEKQTIIDEVSSHPENLTKCFITLSSQMDRSFYAISQMWYQMQNPKSPHYIGTKTAFVLLGKSSVYRGKVNRTNSKETINVKPTLLYKVINTIKKVWNLK